MRYVITGDVARASIIRAVQAAPEGFQVSITEPKRSLEQNARLWAMLGEVSDQVVWYGRTLSPEAWKCVFSASLKKQDVVPGLHGDFVVLGQSTSKMTLKEMSDLIELMQVFGAEKGVRFTAGEGNK